jgi:hypothetical protein
MILDTTLSNNNYDFIFNLLLINCRELQNNYNQPVIQPSINLIQALINTHISTDIKLNIYMKNGIFLFPKQMEELKVPDEDIYIKSIIFSYFEDITFLDTLKDQIFCWLGESVNIKVETPKSKTPRIVWTAKTENLISYGGCFEIISNEYFSLHESIIDPDNFNLGFLCSNDDTEKENTFTNYLQYLLVKLLFYMDCGNQNLEEIKKNIKQQNSNNKLKKELMEPLWLGKNFRIKEESRQKHEKEKHTNFSISKNISPHIRCGHIRKQPYGKKEEHLTKEIWIEPIKVNWY